MIAFFKQWFWLLILVTALLILLYVGLDKYLTFDFLRVHRVLLLSFSSQHIILTSVAFILLYIVLVAISFPGASYLTILGGFLFGTYLATVYVVISATIGSIGVFLAVRRAVNPLVSDQATGVINKMRQGFQENESRYLFFLRILPVFPFWAVNVAAAVFNVHLMTFIVVTFIGIAPGTFIYASLGSGLGHILDENKAPNMMLLFEPHVLLPLVALALLSLLPVFYRKIRQKRLPTSL